MASPRACFTKRPAVVLPDRMKVLAHVSNGASGRALAEAVLDGQHDAVTAMIAHDRRLLSTFVEHDRRMPSAPDGQYGDLLTLAVAQCDEPGIRTLLQAGMPVNGVRPGGALTLALLADTPDMAEHLLQAGATPDPQKIAGGQDPMMEAIAFSHIGGVMTLLRHGADVHWQNEFGVDHLHSAVAQEGTDIAELLADHGASVWTITDSGAMAIHDLMQPALEFRSPALDTARARLVAKAKASGLAWPPPSPQEVRRMVLAGRWPTPVMTAAGMTISPSALAHMRANFPKDAP